MLKYVQFIYYLLYSKSMDWFDVIGISVMKELMEHQ